MIQPTSRCVIDRARTSTPIEEAVRAKRPDIVKVLVEHGADPNQTKILSQQQQQRDSSGDDKNKKKNVDTVLHIACDQYSVNI